MTGSPRAHRTGFTVRCACGNEYHSDDSHIGRRIRCRCGRTVVIERPADAPDPVPAVKKVKKYRRKQPGRFATWSDNTARGAGGVLARFLTLALHDFVHPRVMRRWTTRIAWLVLVFMLAAWISLATSSEHFLPATILAYGPRFLLLAPFVLLVPLALISARRALLPLTIATWVVLVPIMGARFSPTTLLREMPAKPAAGDIRVVTFNTLVGTRLQSELGKFLDEYQPDIVGFQECGQVLWRSIQRLEGWHSYKSQSTCTFSRWPLTMVDSMYRPDDNSRRRGLLGGYGAYSRYRVEAPGGAIDVANVHLPTARYGLQAVLRGDDGLIPSDALDAIGTAARTATGALPDNVDAQLRSSLLARDIASQRASLRASGGDRSRPLVVMGDFNLPVESTIYRTHWQHFTNAFEEVGNGLGWTKQEGKLLRIRIDHVLMNDRLEPRLVKVGRDWYSDHLPVIVDLRRVSG